MYEPKAGDNGAWELNGLPLLISLCLSFQNLSENEGDEDLEHVHVVYYQSIRLDLPSLLSLSLMGANSVRCCTIRCNTLLDVMVIACQRMVSLTLAGGATMRQLRSK